MCTDEYTRLSEEFGIVPGEYNPPGKEFSENDDEFNLQDKGSVRESHKATESEKKSHTSLRTRLLTQAFAGVVSVSVILTGGAAISEEISQTKETVICSECNGTGILDCEFCEDDEIENCSHADSHVICDKCNGSGETEK